MIITNQEIKDITIVLYFNNTCRDLNRQSVTKICDIKQNFYKKV